MRQTIFSFGRALLCAVLAASLAACLDLEGDYDDTYDAVDVAPQNAKAGTKPGSRAFPYQTKADRKRARARCRVAKLANARSTVFAASLARIGATRQEQKRARRLLRKRATSVCGGVARADDKAARNLDALIATVEQRFARGVPGMNAVSAQGLFLNALIPDLADLERRCFSDDLMGTRELLNLTDAQFDAELPSMAWGSCGSSRGAAPGGNWGNWANDSRAGYAECVRDGLRNHVNDLGDSCSSLTGTGGPSGGGQGDGESGAPQPDQDGDDDPTDGPEPGDGGGDGDGGGEPTGDEGTGPAADPSDVAETAGAAAEVIIGAAGVATGAYVIWVSVAAAPETGGASLAGVGVGVFLINQGRQWVQDGWGRLFDQCPAFSTNAGPMGFASNPGTDASLGTFSVADIMHQCRCEHRQTTIDVDPTGTFGDDCSPGRADRLDCMRDPYDATGRMRPECARMAAEDNADGLLSSYAAECAVVTCGGDLVLGPDCNCVLMGGGGGSGGVGSGPGGLCETVGCPEGTTPVPIGVGCACEDVGVGVPGGGHGGGSGPSVPGFPGGGGSPVPSFPGGFPGATPLPLPGFPGPVPRMP